MARCAGATRWIVDKCSVFKIGIRGIANRQSAIGDRQLAILVILGEKTPDHLTHLIPRTVRITMLTEDPLEIESADRSRSLVRCRY